MSIPAADFDFITDLIRVRSGISISKDKDYLLESRLAPITRKLSLINISALVKKIRTEPDESLISEIIEALTTNETLFFRDMRPFDVLKGKALDRVISQSKDNEIRVWSCAASTGQEPYSIAMSLLESAAKVASRKLSITGTDIDQSVLEKAKSGVYSQFEIQRGLPISLLTKYFHQPEPYSDVWLLNDPVKSMVTYKKHNLLEDCTHFGTFDIIFCRNVLIYFEPETKKSIIQKLHDRLKPHGLLFLGSADSIIGNSDHILEEFEGIKGVFQKKK